MTCKTKGCDRPAQAKGFCTRCYPKLLLRVKYDGAQWEDFEDIHIWSVTRRNSYAVKSALGWKRIAKRNRRNEAIMRERCERMAKGEQTDEDKARYAMYD